MKYYYLLIIIIFNSCVNKESQTKANSADTEFAINLISTIKGRSINKENIDWIKFEEEVKNGFKKSKVDGIKKALTLNGNKHTFYRLHDQFVRGDFDYKKDTTDACKFDEFFLLKEIPNNIGYIKIPTFSLNPGLSSQERKNLSHQYILTIYDKIIAEDKRKIEGWVIDLRFNSGGNMWPMLLALRPFFIRQDLGYFIKDGIESAWAHANNEILLDEKAINKTYMKEPIDYQLSNTKKKIAVLIGQKTSSSGEAIAIALSSIEKMAFYGDNTSGFSTANKAIQMAEGEYLILTEAVMADYRKQEYWNGIKVIEKICDEELLLSTVSNWINKK